VLNHLQLKPVNRGISSLSVEARKLAFVNKRLEIILETLEGKMI